VRKTPTQKNIPGNERPGDRSRPWSRCARSFSHPDSTVGFGIAPNQPCGSRARSPCDHTAGQESGRPHRRPCPHLAL